MITLKKIPLFGSGIAGKSYVVTRQRRLNCYMELRQDGDKAKIVIYGTPGLVPAFRPTTPFGLPLRGFLGTQKSLYLVAYNQFQSLSGAGVTLATGSLNTTSGNVSIATNQTQVLIADGQTGYIFTPSSSAFAAIGSNFPVNANTVTFVASFFVAEQPGTQQFWVSNANDGSTWGSTAFASASAYSDNILAVDNLGGNLIIFSEQHFEQWQNSGLTPQPFAPILSAASEYGLAAIYSRAHVAQSIIFLAQNREGQVQFARLQGFSVKIISNPDLDSIINEFTVVSDAVAMVYGTDAHKFYQVTFPTANRSFLYDTATDLWSEVQTGPSVSPTRHIGNFSAYSGGQILVSDYQTNQIYTMDADTYTDNGQTTVREVITRHVLSDFNRIRISNVTIDMETGVGLQSGQGSNPQVMLQYSKDNGRTWSGERWKSLGAAGSYLSRANWRRFGSTKDATFRIRMSDPVKFVITEGSMKIRQKRAA